MVVRTRRSGQARFGERSPLHPGPHSDDVHGQTPHQPDTEPPSYEPFPTYPDAWYRRGLSSLRSKPSTVTITCLIFLIVLAPAVVFIFSYDLPTKVGEYNRAAARMHEQEYTMRREAAHLEVERIAFQGESDRWEKAKLALESATHRSEQERLRLEQDRQLIEDECHYLKVERIAFQEESDRLEKAKVALESAAHRSKQERLRLEQDIQLIKHERHCLEVERIVFQGESDRLEKAKSALESATHRSEQERLRLEQDKQLIEDERHLLEDEKEEWKKERERWEKAREDRVPQGAFWGSLWPSPDCRAYGRREYWGTLENIPEGWSDIEACTNMPAEIKGVYVRRPNRCGYVQGSHHIHGIWMVDQDQVDCKPWHADATDKVGLRKPARFHLNSQMSISRAAPTADLRPVASKPGL